MHETFPVDSALSGMQNRSRSVVLRSSVNAWRAELSVAARALGRLLTPAAPETAPVQWEDDHLWIGLA